MGWDRVRHLLFYGNLLCVLYVFLLVVACNDDEAAMMLISPQKLATMSGEHTLVKPLDGGAAPIGWKFDGELL